GMDAIATREQFYALLTELRFFPNSPTFTGAGTPLGQLAACFVLPITDDMGRDSRGIFSTLRAAALIQQTGGGNGFSFSRLRPCGDHVMTSAGVATGPVGFLRVYDTAFGEIAQGGTRRGANMAVLRIDHPDIFDFIRCKEVEGSVSNFNISVGVTDQFMRAVENDEDFELINPRDHKVWRTVAARELFDEIVKHAHHNGEPGVLFLDAANRQNPVPHLYELEATNPCHRGTNLVHTTLGVVPIKDLVGRDFCVVTPKGDIARAVAFPTGVKSLFRIHLSNGAIIDLTENHHLIMADGMKRMVRDLKPGDPVKLAAHAIEPEASPYRFGEDEGFLLGWNAGDGWITYHSNVKVRAWQVGFVFGRQDSQIAVRMQQQIARRITERTPDLKNRPERGVLELATTNHAFVEYFREALGAIHKSQGIPRTVMQGNRAFQRGYLRGLFSADGYVSVKGQGKKERRQLGLVTAHEKLARDVQVLLATYGIRTFIRHSENTLPGRDRRYQRWQVTVNADQFVRFINIIGFAEDSMKQAAAMSVLDRDWRDTHSADSAAVVKVEDLHLAETVYNLTVDHPDHQFAVNGVISANCGEQWLGPYENCCLGSINLAQHVTVDNRLDWDKLRESTELSTRFLDNVVDANKYVPAVAELAEAAHRARRIGLGIMGLGDVMYRLGVRYGSHAGEEFAGQIMEFVRYHAMKTSIDLARTRGAFPAIKGSLYDPENLKWTPPTPLEPFTRDFSRPPIDWSEIVTGIKKYGIRNAAQTTVAPTGTIATVAGVESYGCEPVFALAYTRHVNDNGKDLRLDYVSPMFERALIDAGVEEAARKKIFERVRVTGTCQDIDAAPEKIRDTFVVAGDITPEEHVRMQGAMQAFVDNSLSKTINFPSTATVDEVAKSYFLAWKLGCKGITVYVAGTREKVVLETKETAHAARKTGAASEPSKKPRPRQLHGATYEVSTPLGKAYVTVNRNGAEQPFEVFCNVGKAGSDTAAVSEAIGRLISLALRLPSPLSPTERLEQIVTQLGGIGGGRPMGFGLQRVRSLPDGIAQALAEDLGQPRAEQKDDSDVKQLQLFKVGDLCPECGHASFVNEEGCRKCYSCGHSEC
ncbi:MAG: hypothetical protein KGJ80_03150, partial [Chloroflexota bacterium]|nr:hypothetical protein [Chloroflexota bacterium]